jgi:hypothetical protein
MTERDGGYEEATSKTEKGDVENGIHSTGSPCWCSKNLVNGTDSRCLKSGHLSGAAERTAMSEPRYIVRRCGIYFDQGRIPGI